VSLPRYTSAVRDGTVREEKWRQDSDVLYPMISSAPDPKCDHLTGFQLHTQQSSQKQVENQGYKS